MVERDTEIERPQERSLEALADPPREGTHSKVAVAGHPLHPMLVTFPIAFLIVVPASDLAYLYFGDEFWARMSIWLLGIGSWMGLLAAITGTVEVLLVRGIRRRAVSWNHGVAAVMLLSVAFANWFGRIDAPHMAILPWGIALSFLGAGLLAFAGWLGGALVFEHQLGALDEPDGD